MSGIATALQAITDALFIALGAGAMASWARNRDRERMELALAMGLLSLVIILGVVVKAAHWQSTLMEDLILTLFMGSGFALLRFRQAQIPVSTPMVRAGIVINVVAVALAFLAQLPTSQATLLSPLQTGAVLALVCIWIIDTGEPAIAFWRSGRRLPRMQRSRLRSLSIGYAGIIMILVVLLASGRAAQSEPVQIGTQVLALVLLPFLYFSIAPPRLLRQVWRQQEEAALRAATGGLVEFSPDTETLAHKSLPWAVRLLGADRGFIVTAKHRVIATQDVARAEIDAILDQLPPGEIVDPVTVGGLGFSRRDVAIIAGIPSRLGRAYLGVISGPLTPIFGGDEIDRLGEYARDFANGYDRVQFTEMIRMLQEIATAANETTSVEEAAHTIISLICTYMAWPLGHAFFPEDDQVSLPPGGHVWVRRGGDELGPLVTAIEERVTRTKGVAAGVFADGEPVITQDLNSLAAFDEKEEAAAAGLSEGYWLPVRSKNDVVGVLQFLSSDGYTPDVSVVHALETAGVALGRVYERAQAVQAAAQAGEAKSEYLSRISHELRTPLTVIIGYADLLTMESPEGERGPLQAILANSNHLLNLVNDVLDISRIESRREKTLIEPTDVDDVVDQCLRVIRPMAEMHHVGIARSVERGTLRVLADRQHLVQALVNLVSNAIKYGGESKSVDVGAIARPGGRVRITVTDNGPGIAPDLVQRLFIPFERIGAERTTITGSGLGLALVKRLAEAMGGSVGVDSQVGTGSAFWIELDAVVETVDANNSNAQPPATVPDKPADGADNSTVLFVDDNAATVEFARQMFELRPKINLMTAATGVAALESAKAGSPGVIVLDMHLPDINGDEVLQRLKSDTATRDIPVLILSADATPQQMQRLVSMGAERYITKPIVVRDFLDVVDDVLDRTPARAG